MGCEIKTEYVLIKGFRTSETIIFQEFIPKIKRDFNLNKTVEDFLKIEKFSMKMAAYPNVISENKKNLKKSV